MKEYKVISYEIERERKSKYAGISFKDSRNHEMQINTEKSSKELESILNEMSQNGWQLVEIIPLHTSAYSYRDDYKNSVGIGISNTKYLKIIFERE